MEFFFHRQPRVITTVQDRLGRQIVIREGHPRDAMALIHFCKQIDTESVFLSRSPGEFQLSLEQEREWLQSMRASNSFLALATHEDRIVGMLDFSAGTWSRVRHAGEFGLSVLKDYWGSGIGGTLLEALFTWSREHGVRKIRLRVVEGNERAIALYERLGFLKEGRHPAEFVIDGQDVALISMGILLE